MGNSLPLLERVTQTPTYYSYSREKWCTLRLGVRNRYLPPSANAIGQCLRQLSLSGLCLSSLPGASIACPAGCVVLRLVDGRDTIAQGSNLTAKNQRKHSVKSLSRQKIIARSMTMLSSRKLGKRFRTLLSMEGQQQNCDKLGSRTPHFADVTARLEFDMMLGSGLSTSNPKVIRRPDSFPRAAAAVGFGGVPS